MIDAITIIAHLYERYIHVLDSIKKSFIFSKMHADNLAVSFSNIL